MFVLQITNNWVVSSNRQVKHLAQLSRQMVTTTTVIWTTIVTTTYQYFDQLSRLQLIQLLSFAIGITVFTVNSFRRELCNLRLGNHLKRKSHYNYLLLTSPSTASTIPRSVAMLLTYPLSLIRCRVARFSALRILWTFLSVMVAATCTFSFLQPFWFFHPDNVHSFGVFNYCVNDPRVNRQVCTVYGGQFNFSRLPSGAWLAACVLLGGGCVFLSLGACLAFLSIFIVDINDQKPATYGGYFQTVAGKIYLSLYKQPNI